MIKIENLKKTYATKANTVVASNDICYEFEDKGLYVILGKSGCGKTTLLNILAGLDSYDQGHIYVEDNDISMFNTRELDDYRNLRIGIIFQEYNLLPDLNVYDNLRIVLELQKQDQAQKDNQEYIKLKINEILKKVGLSGYEKRKISQLSGGERQRIAIARTLLKQPQIIFADEPTGNLDAKTSDKIMGLLKDISKKHLVIMVSHDKESAYKFGDKIIYMSDGSIDDTDIKVSEEYLYSFKLNFNNIESIQLDKIDKTEMIRVITQYINKADIKSNVTISEIRKCTSTEKQVPDISQKKCNGNIIANKLSSKYKMRLSTNFLKKRKIRLLLTTLLLSLTIVFMFFSVYVSFYNKNEIIVEYLEQYKPSILPVYLESEFIDDYYNEQEITYTKGKYLYNKIQKELGTNVELNKVTYEQTLMKDDEGFYDATVIFLNDLESCPQVSKGSIPNKIDDIVITDFIANELSVNVGDKLYYGIDEFNVCGIIETNYKQENLKSKLNYGYEDEFFQHRCLYNYYVAYISDDYISRKENSQKSINLVASNFLISKSEEKYFSEFLDYSSVKNIEKDELSLGRLPVNDNEILVTESFAEEYGISEKELENATYQYKNIYQDKYNNYYSQYINLCEYFSEGIVIVGIVKNSNEEVQSDIYITENIWNLIKEEYYQYYYADALTMPTIEKYEHIIKVADNKQIYFNEPAINNIYSFDNIIADIILILYLILFLTMSINFIMLGTFINISIGENTRNIGILRSLGVTMRDCIEIFDIEFLIIYLSSVFTSGIVISVIIKFINRLYMEKLRDIKYDIVNLNNEILVTVILLELFISIISIRIPIRKMKKKKPIDIINNQ